MRRILLIFLRTLQDEFRTRSDFIETHQYFPRLLFQTHPALKKIPRESSTLVKQDLLGLFKTCLTLG